LRNHLAQTVAADFFVVPTATCRALFVLVLLAHERRRVVHVAVTPRPTAMWTAQEPREALSSSHRPEHAVGALALSPVPRLRTALSFDQRVTKSSFWEVQVTEMGH
jgi:hypothetical protein